MKSTSSEGVVARGIEGKSSWDYLQDVNHGNNSSKISVQSQEKPHWIEDDNNSKLRRDKGESVLKLDQVANCLAKWQSEKLAENSQSGRVLMIDFIGREYVKNEGKKIIVQEFHEVDSLYGYYADKQLSGQSAFRVIHVQNASWARKFFFQKFNILQRSDIIGTAFAKWVYCDQSSKRPGKTLLNGKVFRTQRDPWRKVSWCSFGMDYLRAYSTKRHLGDERRFTKLNVYDSEDNPTYGLDVYVQRLSIYIQKHENREKEFLGSEELKMYVPTSSQRSLKGGLCTANSKGICRTGTGRDALSNGGDRVIREAKCSSGSCPEDYFSLIEPYDNGNTIVIFENSQSGSCEDTLIGSNQKIESIWRLLTYYMPREDTSTDDDLAMECMNLVLSDLFKSLASSWEKLLSKFETHVGILEDKIYENPADETRAPELWRNSNMWLKVERLMCIHIDVLRSVRTQLKELFLEPHEWVETVPVIFDKLANMVQEDLVKPTQNLSDIMYKSVEIRDSHHSIQLGVSMWRLSWITFIFLPLTFVVGFFGMNVDTFESDPPIKWYFISAAPLMAVIIVFWYIIKHAITDKHYSTSQRAAYERLFTDLSLKYPHLWTRSGAKYNIQLDGFTSKLKWNILKYWFKPEKMNSPLNDYDTVTFTLWWNLKCRILNTWMNQISFSKNLPQTNPVSLVVDNSTYYCQNGSRQDGADDDLPPDMINHSSPSTTDSSQTWDTELAEIGTIRPRKSFLPEIYDHDTNYKALPPSSFKPRHSDPSPDKPSNPSKHWKVFNTRYCANHHSYPYYRNVLIVEEQPQSEGESSLNDTPNCKSHSSSHV